MPVTVATFSHKTGIDTRVFATNAGAMRWRGEIAETYFDRENTANPPVPRPSDPEALVQAYWNMMEGYESFDTEECEVEE